MGHAVGPHGDKVAGLRVVQRRAIVDIDRRRRQVVPQACRERDVLAHAITVLHEPRKRLGSQALGIIETRQRRERRKSRQKIGQRASGERPRKGQRPTCLHVAKRVLTNHAAVESRLDEVVAPRPRQRVGCVDGIGRAVLRIVVLVPERRVAETVMRLSPASRVFVHGSGNRHVLTMLPLVETRRRRRG